MELGAGGGHLLPKWRPFQSPEKHFEIKEPSRRSLLPPYNADSDSVEMFDCSFILACAIANGSNRLNINLHSIISCDCKYKTIYTYVNFNLTYLIIK